MKRKRPSRGQPRPLSRSASASRSTVTCRPSSDPQPSPSRCPVERALVNRARCCGTRRLWDQAAYARKPCRIGQTLRRRSDITPYFFIPILHSRRVRLFFIAARSFCGHGSRKRCVVLRTCPFRQGISRRAIVASKVCMVQTPAGAALCSSPSCEQQFWCNPLLLGQDLPVPIECRCGRITSGRM